MFRKAVGLALVFLICSSMAIVYRLIIASPFGTFDFKEIVSDSSKNKHAAIFNYNHGESSGDVQAVWLLEGKFAAVKQDDLKGDPAIYRLAQRPAIAQNDLAIRWPFAC